ncbi:MAG: T9SS type A sorting domain-containing protein [Ignavibacteria bacterium]|nr:T9SS type A sorting domain-containing protein [Ignavibacteria bacterium]
MKQLVLIITSLILCGGNLTAQRKTTGFYDLQENSRGNIAFKGTNYGIFGLDTKNSMGGGYWKRGSANQYIYGGGMWFGTQKNVNNKPGQKLVLISYNPNSGASWMAPSVHPSIDNPRDSLKYAHLYYSTDFDINGDANNVADTIGSYKWPILKKANQSNFGEFIADPALRISSNDKPHFVSAEDVICVYNDAELTRYEGGISTRRAQGYPLGISIVQRTYFFDKAPLQDVLILRYEITHTGSDTLSHCWFAPEFDFDIGPGGQNSSGNDKLKYYGSDSTLGLVVGWSLGTNVDKNKGLGYFGATLLETPKVDASGNLSSQGRELGLKTHRNWVLDNDPKDNGDRYDFMSSGQIDEEIEPGDKRLLMATGPFTMQPGETAVISFAIMFAATASGGDATGSNADVAKLVQLCRDTKAAYSNFAKGGDFTAVHEDIQADVHSLYPNPTTGVTTVEYAVNSPSMVTVEVFDMLSNRVAVLENASRAPGTYRTSFDTQSLPAGVYYFRIDIGGVITLKKLIVVK